MAVDILEYLPNIDSNDNDWIIYFEELKKRYGKSEAKILWNKTWVERGTKEANTSELRLFLDKNGIKLEGEGWFDGFIDSWKSDVEDFQKTFNIISIVVVVIAIIIGIVYLKAKSSSLKFNNY